MFNSCNLLKESLLLNTKVIKNYSKPRNTRVKYVKIVGEPPK